jgi:hypothetical protein
VSGFNLLLEQNYPISHLLTLRGGFGEIVCLGFKVTGKTCPYNFAPMLTSGVFILPSAFFCKNA